MQRIGKKLDEENEGNHKVIVRYQEDGAGPHTAKELINFLDEGFNKRGWMMIRQPPNSPITNVIQLCRREFPRTRLY